MSSRIKVVVTDIDGTIIEEGTKGLNPEYYSLIKDLHAAGIQVIIASGRQTESIEALFAPVLDCISIIGNGGLCIKLDQEERMLDPIPRPWVEELAADIACIPHLDGLFCALGQSFAFDNSTPMARFMIEGYRAKLIETGGPENIPNVPIGKITFFHETEIEDNVPQWVWDKWQNRLNMTFAGDYWLDCVMPGVSKGHALEIILKEWGLSADELLASGDQMNDASMLRLAGRSIAVSNAKPELKAIASEVHENSDFLAVARAWQALLS